MRKITLHSTHTGARAREARQKVWASAGEGGKAGRGAMWVRKETNLQYLNLLLDLARRRRAKIFDPLVSSKDPLVRR